MNYDSYCFTSAGGRDHNEDAVGTRELPDGMLYVLADGLGGHARGEVASGIVVQTLSELPYEAGCDAGAWLADALAEAGKRVLAQQEADGCTMKSTAAALLVQKDCAFWAHVGDSRLYYLQNGALTAVTEDHSVAYKKFRAGEISRTQIAQDPDQSSLLRAIGNPERNQPDSGSSGGALAPGDAFLLCSDGVWTYLRDEEVRIDLLKSDTAQDWGEHLLLRVMERVRPAADNLSLIAVIAT